VLTIAAAQDWPVHQMNVNNAFLRGTSPRASTVSNQLASSIRNQVWYYDFYFWMNLG
jgi:hypothetical protein